eukprot:TRINITY_DN3532_c0_g1_i2.p1 TRINITY_DN3532_c0_g1~~TRINITY_DN3532_c0_g1_i2.p1  ORF type:complete len:718 (-),score=183.51 TRINITY_DN3532_c0_g1_i2:108-2012(-)
MDPELAINEVLDGFEKEPESWNVVSKKTKAENKVKQNRNSSEQQQRNSNSQNRNRRKPNTDNNSPQDDRRNDQKKRQGNQRPNPQKPPSAQPIEKPVEGEPIKEQTTTTPIAKPNPLPTTQPPAQTTSQPRDQKIWGNDGRIQQIKEGRPSQPPKQQEIQTPQQPVPAPVEQPKETFAPSSTIQSSTIQSTPTDVEPTANVSESNTNGNLNYGNQSSTRQYQPPMGKSTTTWKPKDKSQVTTPQTEENPSPNPIRTPVFSTKPVVLPSSLNNQVESDVSFGSFNLGSFNEPEPQQTQQQQAPTKLNTAPTSINNLESKMASLNTSSTPETLENNEPVDINNAQQEMHLPPNQHGYAAYMHGRGFMPGYNYQAYDASEAHFAQYEPDLSLRPFDQNFQGQYHREPSPTEAAKQFNQNQFRDHNKFVNNQPEVAPNSAQTNPAHTQQNASAAYGYTAPIYYPYLTGQYATNPYQNPHNNQYYRVYRGPGPYSNYSGGAYPPTSGSTNYPEDMEYKTSIFPNQVPFFPENMPSHGMIGKAGPTAPQPGNSPPTKQQTQQPYSNPTAPPAGPTSPELSQNAYQKAYQGLPPGQNTSYYNMMQQYGQNSSNYPFVHHVQQPHQQQQQYHRQNPPQQQYN